MRLNWFVWNILGYSLLLTMDVVERNISEMGHLDSLVSEFPPHVFSGGFLPVSLRRLVRYGVESDLMPLIVQLVDQLVVRVFVADEERGSSRTTVYVRTVVENFTVRYNVEHVNCIIKGEEDELKYF